MTAPANPTDEFRLDGKVALVTGGSRGLGREMVLAFARCGADVVIASRKEDACRALAAEVEGSTDQRALAVGCHVGHWDQCDALAARALDHFGRVDVLVNNAGITGPTARAQDVSRGEWENVLEVNLTGAFLCAKAVIPSMVERRNGQILNIASMAGKTSYALRSPYAVSKWGLIGLTKTLAAELGEFNVQVNAVCPGPVAGDRMNNLFTARAIETGQSADQVRQDYLDTTLMGRLVDPEDVASMVMYLASDAGRNITGQAIEVSAGYAV